MKREGMKNSQDLNPLFILSLFLLIHCSSPHVIPKEVEGSSGGRRGSKDLTAINSTSGTNITSGVGGGFYRMKNGQVIAISSSNYGQDTYFNGEAVVWRFFGSDCGVSASCPCFDVPSTIKCWGDYLKISDIPFYEQRFCGDVKPTGVYRSGSGHLRIRFRSDFADSGRGFLCYVSCTAPGKADPQLPSPTCFTVRPEPGPGCGPDPLPTEGDVTVNPPIIGSTPGPCGTSKVYLRQVTPEPTRQREKDEQKVNWIPVAGRKEVIH